MPPKRKGKAGASAVPALQPEGSGRNKRTPVSAFGGAAGKDVYAVLLFSAAGRMHGDTQKNKKAETLEHSLFAALNTDYLVLYNTF